MLDRSKKRFDAPPLVITASDKEKREWLENQHELAIIFFGYKSNPVKYMIPDFVDRLLTKYILTDELYDGYFFAWGWRYDNTDDDPRNYEGLSFVYLSTVYNSQGKYFLLEKDTVLQWAREAGVLS